MHKLVVKAISTVRDLTAKALRPALRHSVLVKSILYRLLWMLPERFREPNAVRDSLKTLETAERQVFFVNIGSNDGLAGDPLREFIITRMWEGILVEPVPYVFDRLKKAYRSRPGVSCENVAIAETTGSKPFWYLRENRILPPGYDQVGSFDRDRVEKYALDLFPGSMEFLDCCEGPCMTLQDLLAKHSVSHVDVFLIDTEGYDATVVEQIDLMHSPPPSVIIYEHVHLSSADRERCRDRLRTARYEIRECGGNTVATLRAGLPME